MKKFFLSMLLLLLTAAAGLMAQPVIVASESFDNARCIFTAPKGGWSADSSLRVSGKRAYLGFVPTQPGDSVELISEWIDCQNYSDVLLQFSHICKVSVCDYATIEFQVDQLGSKWQRLPQDCYKGTRVPYRQIRFYQKSYNEWLPDDSLATPTNSWWKTEVFDLSSEISWERVRFKFKIKRGNVAGTQFAYGWLIDDFTVYGATGPINIPVVEFQTRPSDTSYVTGPFRVRAKVATRTIARIYPPKLQITYTYQGVNRYDSIPMNRVEGDSIWEALIPQQLFGTEITYSITGKDTVGNAKTITGKTVLKRFITNGKVGYVETCPVAQYLPVSTYAFPSWQNYTYGWTKTIYNATEMGGSGLLTRLAYKVVRTGASPSPNQEIWFKEVKDTLITYSNYVDPERDGYTKVYSGTWDPTVSGWRELKLDNPFVLHSGYSLLVMWVNKANATCNPYASVQVNAMNNVEAIYATSATGAGSTPTWNEYMYKPVARFFKSGSGYRNSVALVSIDHPTESVIAGNSTPVTVTIRNEGLANLTSCNINWSVNGTLQTPYKWTGNLPDNYMDTNITIGSFVPTAGKYDNLVVWVSDPNNVKDSATSDDTLSLRTFGCGSKFAGKYVVGPNSGADFASLTEAISKIGICGSNGNVYLMLQSGTYSSYTLGNLSSVMNGDTLFISSLSGKKEDVIFNGSGGTAMFVFSNAHNVVVSDVSFIRPSTASFSYGVQFDGGCKNVELRNCYIYMDTVGSNTLYPVYKASSAIACEDIRIIGNVILGGYYGVYFYGGNSTSNYSKDLVFDYNLLQDAYYYGYYFYYNHFKSFSHKTIIPRTRNNNTYYYTYFYYTNLDKCNGNKYDFYDFPGANIYNYFYYINRNNTTTSGMFTNNEIIGSKKASNMYGMYLGYSNLDIYNNTFLLKNGYGIYAYNYNQGLSNIENNIFVNTATTGTYDPLYVGSSPVANGIGNLDYNLYYSKGRVGYWLGNKTTITAWRTATGKDAHSVFMKPVFFNLPDLDSLAAHTEWYDSAWTHDLRLAVYSGLECPVPAGITDDIEGTPRTGNTIMGCYAAKAMGLDAAISSQVGVAASVVKGQKQSLSAVLTNMGVTKLTSANIVWSLNGVQRNGKSWTGSLETYESDTVYLDTLTAFAMDNTLKVWVTNPNNNKDDNVKNDTLVFYFHACDSMFHGVYTVGSNNADFATLNDAITNIRTCSVDGPVTLMVQKGTYDAFSVEEINGLSARNFLTITSATGKAEDVVFDAVSEGYALSIKSAKYVHFKNLTFNGKTGNGAVTMIGACKGLRMEHCELTANTSGSTYVLYRPSGATCDSIFFRNNVFEGGYYGFYFYGSGTGSGGYNTNIYIDSNQFLNSFYYTYYMYYNDLKSFSHNVIRTNTMNNYNYSYFYYTNHYNTVCNTWDYSQSNVKYPYIYFYYPHRYNYSGTDGYIMNNEFILPEDVEGGYGMYIGYSGETYHIYHNSVYNPCATNGYGIYAYCGSAGNNANLEFVNNLVWGNNYPIYISGSAVSVTSDYNDYYSTSGKVGYWQSTACSSLSAWATASGDNTSVSVQPSFLAPNIAGLELVSNNGITCPSLANVLDDITGYNRNVTTTMGCYELNPKTNDIYMATITEPRTSKVLVTGDTVPVFVYVRNLGSAPLTSFKMDWIANGVSMPARNWSGNIASLAMDTLYVGHFTAISGNNRIKVWSSLPNNKADERPFNDTASVTVTGCDSLFQGVFTMGKGGDFKDIDDFLSTVANCGLGGPLTLKVLNGSYDGLLLDKVINGTSTKNTITITSASGNADSVVFYNSQGQLPTVVFGKDLKHVLLEKVTIKGYVGSKATTWSGVGFYGCDSVTVRNCKILCDAPEEAYSEGSAITSVDFSNWTYYDCGLVSVENNLITGARYGMYFEVNSRISRLRFVNNDVRFRYVVASMWGWDLQDFSYNTFIFEPDTNAVNPLKAIYLAEMYSKSSTIDTMRFVGNRYLLYDVKTSTDVWTYIEDFYPDSCFLFANNEFVLPKNCGTNEHYIDYINQLHFVNNSFYLPQGGSIWFYYQNSPMVMLNNNFVAGTGSLGLDFEGTRMLYSDYNNVIGMKLADLQRSTGLDSNSVQIMPIYSNLSNGLNMLDNSGFDCPRHPAVLKDINGKQRSALTTIGCYEVVACGNNIMPRAMVSPKEVSITGAKTPVTVTVLNAGSNTVKSFKLDATVNGRSLPQYSWTGTLASKASVNVQIGDFIPEADSNLIVVWTSMPNNGVDSLPANDTLSFLSIGCDSILHGDYVVNNTKELNAILTKLTTCGVNAPVRVFLANGSYNAPNLQSEFIGVTKVNNVTFESKSGNADSVVLYDELTLGGMQHINFRNLTFKRKTSPYVVNMVSYCKDIEFKGCKFLGHPTTTTTQDEGSYCFYKANNSSIDSLRLIGNLFDGGYYGLLLEGGGTNNMNDDIVIDSNTFSNQYYYGVYFYYNEVNSFSHNTVLSRITSANTYWYGIISYYSNFNSCNGNRVHQRSASITYPYPAYFYYAGMYGRQTTSYFTNNELMGSTANQTYCLYVYGCDMNIFHNTIYMTGAGAGRAIYAGGTGNMVIKNNILVVTNSAGYPIYMGTAGCAESDYNCIYAPTYAGYSNSAMQRAAWQAAGFDVHSFFVSPKFVMQDSTEYLKLANYSGLFVPVLSPVNADRLGKPRAGMTIVGAYTQPQEQIDAALVEFDKWSSSAVIGQVTPVSVRLINMGYDKNNLTSAKIDWYVNKVKQGTVNWKGNLAPYASEVVALGSFKPIAGSNVVSARVYLPNNTADMEISNDSISTTTYGCDSLLHGTYRVGGSGRYDFATINDALDALSHCGVNGPTTFLIAAGKYSTLTLEDYNGASHKNMVTFTSATGKASDVVFSGTDHVILNAAKHIRLANLTFGAGAGTRGVTFNSECKDIELYHCEVLMNATATTSGTYGIYRPQGKSLDSIRFIGNHISGAYYGVYFMGNGTGANGYNTNIVFDSNLVEDPYYYTYYFYYNDIQSFSHNTFLPRVSGYSYLYNYLYYCNLKVMDGNRYNSTRNKNINYYYNYAYYINRYNATGRGLICNNEVIHTRSGGYGFYLGYSNMDFTHNSIYASSNQYAIYSYSDGSTDLRMKNNNIVCLTGEAIRFYNVQGGNVTFEGNNMYGSNGIYINDMNYLQLNDMISATGDTSLSSVLPSYIDVTESLEQSDYVGLSCDADAIVRHDINGKARSIVTSKGAYSITVVEGKNLEMTNIISPKLSGVVACYPDYSKAEVEITNKGTESIDFAKDGVKICMSSDSANVFYVDTLLSKGILRPMQKMTVKLTDFFPTSYTGFYNIKAWVECAKDTTSKDDSAYTIYEVTRVVLPFETDFSVIPLEFAFDSIQGEVQWELMESLQSSQPAIQPDFGTGMLHFGSSTGRASLSRAVIKQVDLLGSTKPQISFWFAHDNSNPNSHDYVELLASTDGGTTYKRLMTVYRYDATCQKPTWKMYQYDLSAYVKETCLHLAFEAGSYGGGDQNIDRIRIQVEQDMEVSRFLLSDSLTACDLKGRALDVVLTNSTMYDVNYERPDSVKLHVNLMKPDSSVTNITKVLRGRLLAGTTDTLRVVDAYDFDQPGTYTFRAFVDTVTFTTDASNDTLVQRMDVLPDLAVVAIDAIPNMSMGDVVKPTVYVVNTGNLTAEKVSLRMKVNDDNDIVESSNFPLMAGDTLKYTFKQGFTVPEVSADQPFYFLSVESEMSCDMDATNDVYTFVGGVNLTDMSVYSIGTPKPAASGCDTGKKEIFININLYNYSDVVVDSATVHVIVDSANTVYAEFTELVTNVAVGNTNMSLHTSYKVPNFTGNYKVTVYVENVKGDMNNSNDTAIVEACAVKNDVAVPHFLADRYQLGQNIPNPAGMRTSIPFYLPQEANVTLSVLGVNGQLLFSKEIHAMAGKNVYELDVNNLASGIYYYAMEYKGQRLVKKMQIVK